jgi:serine/threonine protein kinase
VAFAHLRGIIHRDLKPENVMIGAFGEVLVLDWGVAKVRLERELSAASQPSARQGTGAGAVIGTPGYMAPEQETGASAEADERTDVYALGGILARLLEESTDGPPPSALAAIAARAQARNPVDRYPAVSPLAEDVRRFTAGMAVTAYAETFVERAHRVIRPYRAAILLVAMYLLVRFALLLLA